MIKYKIKIMIRLDLKLHCLDQVYVIIAICDYVVNKKLIYENCTSFTNCISRINNTQVDDPYDIDVVMPMYNLMECSDNYLKRTGIFLQYCKD